MNKCFWHLCVNVTNNKFCSQNCKNKFYVDKRRKMIKRKAVAFFGGECFCGYNKCDKVLEFHHLNPGEKDFNLSLRGHSRSWERVKEELIKCIMVCANCHREIHAGLHDETFLLTIQYKQLSNGYEIEDKKRLSKIVENKIIRESKRPEKEILEKLVWEMSCVKIGQLFGVSDNAVNKWCKFYGINKPGRGDWEKIKHGKILGR